MYSRDITQVVRTHVRRRHKHGHSKRKISGKEREFYSETNPL
jgi:hypothetical protein